MNVPRRLGSACLATVAAALVLLSPRIGFAQSAPAPRTGVGDKGAAPPAVAGGAIEITDLWA